jgi:hypothetical protein
MELRPRRLADGTVIYPMRGWEPPPAIPGYRRLSMDPKSPDAWAFAPELEPCEFRDERQVQRESCKCWTLVQYCTKAQQEVQTGYCTTCPHKVTDKCD